MVTHEATDKRYDLIGGGIKREMARLVSASLKVAIK
jgi:hypothetical protein